MLHNYRLKLLASVARPAAFEGAKVGFKVDDKGALVLQDGKPIYVKTDGSEAVFDYAQTEATIARLNREAQTHREAAEAATTKLKIFGDLDPVAARTALDTVGKLDAKKLIDAGEVDRVRNEIKTGYDAQLAERDTALSGLQTRLNNVLLSHAFASSKFVTEKTVSPPDMLQATFGPRFKIENDRIVGVGADGHPILSKSRMGENADFDEALSIIVDGYANKNHILKGVNNHGTGNNGGGGNNGGKKTLTIAQFDQLSPSDQAAHAAAVRTGSAALID